MLRFWLFPLILLLSKFSLLWLNLSLLFYGITQGGSHLIWHLSGSFFAGKDNSAQFSTVNVLTVGIRGVIAPLTGCILCKLLGPITVLLLGSICCFYGFFVMTKKYCSQYFEKLFNKKSTTDET